MHCFFADRISGALAAALLLGAWLPAAGQTDSTAALHLEVTDSAGAGLPASGELLGPARRAVSTGGEGRLDLAGLPPGRYRLVLRHPGFAEQAFTLDLKPGAVLDQTVALAPGGVSTSITVSDTPIGKADTPLNELPAPIQTVSAAQIEAVNANDLADALNKRVNGVYINDNAGNPFEFDVNYRGYTASPLLGTPQGLSVYLDGVRQNQPFGDIVAWDLIPKQAIRTVELAPGSDPVYGLNTLGGALAVRTKDGASEPGLEVETVGGAFGRASTEGQYGIVLPHGFDGFAAGNYYREDGWRQDSPSEVRQSFAKLRWAGARTAAALEAGYSINSLTGNGLQDFRAVARSYGSVYSIPDVTRDHAPSLTFNATHDFTPALGLSANAYVRHVRSDTTNGDINNDSFGNDLYTLSPDDQAALAAAGYPNAPATGDPSTEPFPFYQCLAQALESADPSDACDGITTNTTTQQNNYGLSGLLSLRSSRNHFAAGAAWDRSSLSFSQLSQFGYLAADGVSILPVPAFADGTTTDDNGDPVDTRVGLHGIVQTGSVYATDTLTAGRWSLTASARFNRTGLDNLDRLPPGDGRGSLTASNTFQRLNPSIGAVYRTRKPFDLYANYGEASRAPTTLELGCADPRFPCNLPNALVSDPPLHQVVTRTVEAGVRSSGDRALRWTADWFRSENSNDLLFVASEQLGFGNFLNFGRTERQGVELDVSAHSRTLEVTGGYTFLSATYQSPQTLSGATNSASDTAQAGEPGVDGVLAITPGDRIPQAPRQLFKGLVEWRPAPKWSAMLNVLATGASFARGNENNLDRPDGVYYLGSGVSPAYGVVNLGGAYQASPRFQLFVQANNLFDAHYANAAQLGATPFDNSGRFVAQPFAAGADGAAPVRSTTFLAPGAPLNVYGGLRVRLR